MCLEQLSKHFHVRIQNGHIKMQLQYVFYHSFTVFKNDEPGLKTKAKPKGSLHSRHKKTIKQTSLAFP